MMTYMGAAFFASTPNIGIEHSSLFRVEMTYMGAATLRVHPIQASSTAFFA